ncbi:hypothetical protein CONLIGDRAFT_214076 [Coniochaeta ligniaria NRRL 30616]|uniref:Uncharacterized protein n=1 Tax=Coniochaeta ligniaria NRRL 30616 TaxID=1408157 RepID=A0A1J7K235_9PEZI|nr:hypothetical protein CONLIGDRAFT_214076 [Coniochaeta ligniaria NRRL 30616]
MCVEPESCLSQAACQDSAHHPTQSLANLSRDKTSSCPNDPLPMSFYPVTYQHLCQHGSVPYHTHPPHRPSLPMTQPSLGETLRLVAQHHHTATIQALLPFSPHNTGSAGMSLEPATLTSIPPGAVSLCPGVRQSPEQICSSAQGHVFYTPGSCLDRRLRAAAPPSFPTPRIRPRQRRPQSIHIVTYPPGYIPSDLRPHHLP